MSRLFTIRGNLTLINIIVTATILILVAGALIKARNNGQQGLFLSSSVQIESMATSFLAAATEEKRTVNTLVNRISEPSNAELSRLKELSAVTKIAGAKLVENLKALINRDPDYFNGTRFSLISSDKKVGALTEQLERAEVYRANTLIVYENPAESFDKSILTYLPSTLQKSIESAAQIVEGMSYLPTQNSVLIDRYNDLAYNYRNLFTDIAEYDELLTTINYSDVVRAADTNEEFTTFEARIDAGWKELSQFNSTNNNESLLLSFMADARTQYYKAHTKQQTQLKAKSLYGYDQLLSRDAWEHSIKSLRLKQRPIIAAALERIDSVGIELHRQSVRHTSTLAILLVLSLYASYMLFWLGRRIKQQADTDLLTGLANRFTVETALKQASRQSDSLQNRQALFFIDLNGFRQINDNYGHAIGDGILIEASNRLREFCSNELIARLGGDEFVVYNNNVSKDQDLGDFAESTLDALKGDFKIDGRVLPIEGTMGYAVAPDNSSTGLELLKNADIALYRSQQHGAAQRILRYSTSMGDSHSKRRKLEADLLAAIEERHFTLHYQPKVCSVTCTVRSVEALIRWERDGNSLVSPAEFIPVAEELGLMEKIGTFVMEKACKDIASMHGQGFAGLGVAVNISVQQFLDELFYDKVINSVRQANLEAGYLELELTESIVMDDIGRVRELLNQLRSQGISIAIDDFGTGYSCLSHLQDLPLDTLKIDRAFVDQLDKTHPHQTVANSIVKLAVLFEMTTVAEGVENEAQRREVENLGIDLIQGYFYSKPVSIEELPDVIRNIESRQPETLQGPTGSYPASTNLADQNLDTPIDKAA